MIQTLCQLNGKSAESDWQRAMDTVQHGPIGSDDFAHLAPQPTVMTGPGSVHEDSTRIGALSKVWAPPETGATSKYKVPQSGA